MDSYLSTIIEEREGSSTTTTAAHSVSSRRSSSTGSATRVEILQKKNVEIADASLLSSCSLLLLAKRREKKKGKNQIVLCRASPLQGHGGSPSSLCLSNLISLSIFNPAILISYLRRRDWERDFFQNPSSLSSWNDCASLLRMDQQPPSSLLLSNLQPLTSTSAHFLSVESLLERKKEARELRDKKVLLGLKRLH